MRGVWVGFRPIRLTRNNVTPILLGMDVVIYIALALIVAGGGLALYERRKKRILLRHDFNNAKPVSSHLQTEQIRARDHFGAHYGHDGFSDHQ